LDARPSYRIHLSHTLPNVTELRLEFNFNVDFPALFLPIVFSTVESPFPVLKTLRLYEYNDAFGTFSNVVMPSVQELYLKNHRGPITHPWHTILPNLRSLHFEIETGTEVEEIHQLTFILTHFSGLTELDLNIGIRLSEFQYCITPDFWEILTGGAQRPFDTSDLLTGELKWKAARDNIIPVDGVFQVPSLGNMRGNKDEIFGVSW